MKKLHRWKSVVILTVVYVITWFTARAAFFKALETSREYSVEMLLIIPAVVVLMGLFEVWVPRDMVKDLLGSRSGGRGILVAFLMGTAPTGPLYVAFPLAASLMKKGAGRVNIIVFLGAWAAAKIPQIAMEAKFLGLDFALTRLLLTAAALFVMGHIGEGLLSRLGEDTAGGGTREQD